MRRSKITFIKVLCILSLLVLVAVHIALRGKEDAGRAAGEGGGEESQVGIDALMKELDAHTPRKYGEDMTEKLENGEAGESLAGARMHGLPNISQEELRQDEKEDISIEDILKNIYEANYNQVLRNEERFGPISNSTIVIVIQVHNRLVYLRQLIESLRIARDIDKTLLVFSHDVWDVAINRLVRSIDFARLVQIFYPFSLQTHPHSFPGESPKDCPRDAKPDRAKVLGCTNAHWPDIHGHYREAKFTQTKHHWWWKTNQVFHRVEVLVNFNGTVLFLEEDHFVSEDFLYVLNLMQEQAAAAMPDNKVDILCLGTYLRKFNPKASQKQPGLGAPAWPHIGGLLHPGPMARKLHWAPNFLTSLLSVFHKGRRVFEGPEFSANQKVEVTQWVSSKHNMGMAFNRDLWSKISACSKQFCQYDDYNWDWSLQHVSLHCLAQKLQVMLVKGPRVFHIGECGVHHKKADCDSNVVIQKVKTILKTAKNYLFPPRLSVMRSVLKKKLKLKKGNGGWGDRRDHALCLNMTIASG